MATRETVASLSKRLQAFEDEKAIRTCMNQYMYLCDILDVGFPLDDLMVLFTEDAVWEGRGRRYGKTFGQHQGKDAIRAMFAKYTQPPAHFDTNVHFLTSELIDVQDGEATGSWVLLQTSTFSSGKSQLSSARLSVKFRCDDGIWRMNHFQTESLFNRPVTTPWDQPADLPVPE
ncbi:nuclear transport factor 2 family protein [Pontibacterium sp. N1Y112]|uniref:Nuclear transport factor 2 family protein n=1 Tax=Pontibacterium sinense TaxID=2781979 RepID=A0A8J7FKA3_9GAMM|nr:nuclear transport factor 2 family protein [Pontibacterium sinense]MBE9397798.1 nuclear transport factor 2 family protein [Pontibacterium sinense]